MRIMTLLLLTVALSSCAAENKDNDIVELSDKVADNSKVLTLPGHLTQAQLVKRFQEIQAGGIDTSKPYKWEFRFTSKIMSSLEDFAQTAHILNFWPVALESDISGDKYWLHIQKTHQYTQDEFVSDVTKLFEMAEYRKLNSFDGFSIDNPDPN
jgi:hypothetical protein